MVGQEPTGLEVEQRIRQIAEIQQAAAEYAAARYTRDQVIRKAIADGCTLREVAEAAGLSFARIHQIVNHR